MNSKLINYTKVRIKNEHKIEKNILIFINFKLC